MNDQVVSEKIDVGLRLRNCENTSLTKYLQLVGGWVDV